MPIPQSACTVHPLALAVALLLSCDRGASERASEEAPEAEAEPHAFDTYRRRSMSSEAVVNLNAMQRGLNTAIEYDAPVELVSAPMTPEAGSCCKKPEGFCLPDPEAWSHPGWRAIGFEVREPHRYSYAVEVEGDRITLRAAGDLDCNGVFSDFSMVGTKNDNGHIEFGPLQKKNELE